MLETLGDVGDHGAELRASVVRRRALDQHGLVDPLGVGAVDDLRGAAGVADAGLPCVSVWVPDVAAEHERQHDEDDPADDRRLAVPGAPASGGCCDVA